MINRKKEIQTLESALYSGRAEFMVVYGRRRVGKTFLIKEYFKGRFSFYATGVFGTKTRDQLKTFNKSLVEYGCEDKTVPKDWLEAFSRLREILKSDMVLKDPASGRRVIFIDELPWMDTARSDFKMALDYFWNSYASAQKDILLIVCGSATSWIINNLLKSKGGFYNRVTRKIHLSPFTLGECEELVLENGLKMTRNQVLDTYMVFGGVPYYYNLLDHRLSLSQNIDELIFDVNGQLHNEFDMLFNSLFKKADKHYSIINALSKSKKGMTRVELSKEKNIGDGEPLTKALSELEQCGFIRKYNDYSKEKTCHLYQIIDPFVLFCIKIREEKNIRSWSTYIGSSSYYSWRGNAFEVVCLNHINQIKEALKVYGVESNEYAWKSRKHSPGAQIDLLIDRRDGIINLCEDKYTDKEYVIDQSFVEDMKKKAEAFVDEAHPGKAIHLTLISATSVKRNEYYNSIQNIITGDDLFKQL